MPKCLYCGLAIQTGRTCNVCGQDEQIAGGWDAIAEELGEDSDE